MSMSRKGTPSHNAILKYEIFYIERLLRTTNDVVFQSIRAYISYYNTRILAKLNHLSPAQYWKKMVQ
ncbi:IS3 family transposase [Kurthia senegalensis]|uniref:IS3 family transposase n=1 Tax=Kurthia senegalensis TaxID=1033740 RepID=UPI0011CB2B41